MSLWVFVAIVGWASFHYGRWSATLFRPRVHGATIGPVARVTVVMAWMILAGAVAFFVWNQSTRVYDLSRLHAALLAACAVFGYQSMQTRRVSLQRGINALSTDLVEAFVKPFSPEERLQRLLIAARRNPALASELKTGLLVMENDGRPRAALTLAGHTLVDDDRFNDVGKTSVEDRLDILLCKMGFALLAKLGEDVMPKHLQRQLSAGASASVRRSSERTKSLLDPSEIDWPLVNEAVYIVSEARLRRGTDDEDMTAVERRVRSERLKESESATGARQARLTNPGSTPHSAAPESTAHTQSLG